MNDTKVCLRCRRNLPLSSFAKSKSIKQGAKHRGLHPWCRACCSEHSALKKSVDYELELYKQNGGCAICGSPPPPGRRLHVDHCYETGLFRGLLCFGCNTRVSVLEDKPFVRKARRYLEKNT